MPELPEVETICRELQSSDIINKKISEVQIFWPNFIGINDIELFKSMLMGQSILGVSRRGKFIILTFSNSLVAVHLRMTGKFEIIEPSSQVNKHEHLRLLFENGLGLRYEDQRKFGRWFLDSEAEVKLQKLGQEPLNISKAEFGKIFSKKSCMIKPFLLDQTNIAGLGNIYVDEALWEAYIHPCRKSNSLSAKELDQLYQAIRKVLEKGIKNRGTSLGSHSSNYYSTKGKRGGNQYRLNVFRQEGVPCSRCSALIVKIKVAQRGTHYCPQCQNLHYSTIID